tara:strand:+ start:466 stop:774 length:309 start_codon:yes stop_codon:yes gene_type:complete
MRAIGNVVDLSEALPTHPLEPIRLLTPVAICDPDAEVRQAGIDGLADVDCLGDWKIKEGRMFNGKLMLRLSKEQQGEAWAIICPAPLTYLDKPVQYHSFEIQ